MENAKTYVFGNDGSNGMMGLLASMCQQRGVDPNMLAALMSNNNNGLGGNGAWFMWIIFLFFLMGWGNWNGQNGNGNAAGLANMINNDSGRELLMQGINGNNAAINQLSSMLNCNVNQIQAAINAVQQAVNNAATGQERGFSSVAYETQRQTCDLQNTIKDMAGQILAGQKAAEMREMQGKIDTLRDLNSQKDAIISNNQQTAVMGQMIQQATAPIAAAVAGIQNEVSGLKCQLPKTVNVPFPEVVAVPAWAAAQYGLNYGANNIWG